MEIDIGTVYKLVELCFLTCLILFSGFVPVLIALIYSSKLLREAKRLGSEGETERKKFEKRIKQWLVDEYTPHMVMVINGKQGALTKKVKRKLDRELKEAGFKPSISKAIKDGISGIAEDYGLSKKTSNALGSALEYVFNKPSEKEKKARDDKIREYAKQVTLDGEVKLQEE